MFRSKFSYNRIAHAHKLIAADNSINLYKFIKKITKPTNERTNVGVSEICK